MNIESSYNIQYGKTLSGIIPALNIDRRIEKCTFYFILISMRLKYYSLQENVLSKKSCEIVHARRKSFDEISVWANMKNIIFKASFRRELK